MKSRIASIVLVLIVLVAAVLALRHSGNGAGTAGAPPAPPAPITFYCGAGNTFQATFATSSVALLFSDGTSLALPQTRSGSGIRYEATTTGADLLFMGKGDTGSFTNSASSTDFRYHTCMAANVASSTRPGYDTYTNLGKSFTFAFPTTFAVAGVEPGYGPGWSAPATTTGMVLAKVDVPRSFEPGTNFGNAWFTVGTSADPQSVTECLENLSGTTSATTTTSIDGMTYTELQFVGVGAGNIYDTTSYRTVKDNQCYAIEYTIHYGNILNYPTGAVKEFDEQKVTTALDEVARSFKFLQ